MTNNERVHNNQSESLYWLSEHKRGWKVYLPSEYDLFVPFANWRMVGKRELTKLIPIYSYVSEQILEPEKYYQPVKIISALTEEDHERLAELAAYSNVEAFIEYKKSKSPPIRVGVIDFVRGKMHRPHGWVKECNNLIDYTSQKLANEFYASFP